MAKTATKSSTRASTKPQTSSKSRKSKPKKPTVATEAAPRYCYCVPADSFIRGEGYRASIVVENEPGHRPTGDWPCGAHGSRPYFWGDNGERGRKRKWTLERAEQQAQLVNERNLGLSEDDVIRIIASTMRQSMSQSLREDLDDAD